MVDQSADEVASGSSAERARPRVVLGVAGGIAAYKACEVLRRFSESGHDVTVVPTAAALEFVGAPTWAALSGKPVSDRVWDDVHEVPHVRIGQQADLVVVAPATADLLAKAAHGLADDLLTNTLLTARCPILMVPAMHTEMWEHPATRDNVATLRARGVHVLEPAEGRLTGADTGKGRLPDPEAIVEAGRDLLVRPAATADLTGRRVVVSAGGTREFLDPVRFLGNRSSGRQGFALARAAAARGAEVTLVAANTDLTPPAGVDVRRVVTTAELREAMLEAAADADAIVMAAAPADFAPAAVSSSKIKKSADGTVEPIELVQNPDILAELVAERQSRGRGSHRVIVGFAAETGDANASVMEHAQAKLARKGCDLLVLNDVGGGAVFGETDNEAWILEHPGGSGRSRPGAAPSGPERIERGPKALLSHAIWDRVARLLDAAGAQQTSPPEPPDRHGASVES